MYVGDTSYLTNFPRGNPIGDAIDFIAQIKAGKSKRDLEKMRVDQAKEALARRRAGEQYRANIFQQGLGDSVANNQQFMPPPPAMGNTPPPLLPAPNSYLMPQGAPPEHGTMPEPNGTGNAQGYMRDAFGRPPRNNNSLIPPYLPPSTTPQGGSMPQDGAMPAGSMPQGGTVPQNALGNIDFTGTNLPQSIQAAAHDLGNLTYDQEKRLYSMITGKPSFTPVGQPLKLGDRIVQPGVDVFGKPANQVYKMGTDPNVLARISRIGNQNANVRRETFGTNPLVNYTNIDKEAMDASNALTDTSNSAGLMQNALDIFRTDKSVTGRENAIISMLEKVGSTIGLPYDAKSMLTNHEQLQSFLQGWGIMLMPELNNTAGKALMDHLVKNAMFGSKDTPTTVYRFINILHNTRGQRISKNNTVMLNMVLGGRKNYADVASYLHLPSFVRNLVQNQKSKKYMSADDLVTKMSNDYNEAVRNGENATAEKIYAKYQAFRNQALKANYDGTSMSMVAGTLIPWDMRFNKPNVIKIRNMRIQPMVRTSRYTNTGAPPVVNYIPGM